MHRHDGQEGGGECGRVHVPRAGRQPGIKYFYSYKNIFTTKYYVQVFAVTRQRQIMSDDKCLDSKGAAGEAGVSMVR